MSFINRIGTFFILLGIGLIGLFILSDIAQAPTCNFLVLGAVSLIVGIALWFRDPAPQGPPPERFRILKSINKRKPRQRD